MHKKIVDLCKIGKCPAVCTNKASTEIFPGEYIYFCNSVGDCDHKRRALMSIEEEPENKEENANKIYSDNKYNKNEIDKLATFG